MHTFEAWVW